MKSKKKIRSIAWLISLCLLMTGFSAHAEELASGVEEAVSGAEAAQEERAASDGEAEQEEMTDDAEIVQGEGAQADAETEQGENQTVDMDAVQTEEDGISLADENSLQRSNGLSLNVEYPSQIKCGEPVLFRITATGGSGNYKYRLSDLSIKDGSERVMVYDITNGPYSKLDTRNEFELTFYASGTYYIRFHVMDMNTNAYKQTGLNEHPISIQDSQYPSVEQRVDTIANQCLKECSTDFEKALWLHDWILDNADYDYTYSYCSAEGVLARGAGTCEAYHRAYVMLLNKVGIETGRITGNGHVWTAVKMDGKWYQVDSTWDDMGKNYKGTFYEHLYFGITDSIMALVHSDHKAAVPGYESSSLENNYFIKTGEIRKWTDPFTAAIEQKIAAGETDFVLAVTDPMPDGCKDVIYNLAAYQLSKDDWGDDVLVAVSYSREDRQLVCKAKKARPITNVSLNKSQLTLTEGQKSTLAATIEPADTTESKALSWSTSNAKVATVTNGTVTAISAGEATITAKAGNGKSSVCKITVTRKAKPITKVSLNKSQLTLTEGQKSTLAATIEPADTTESKALSWSTSNAKVATVANGTVTAVSAGEATITAKAGNGKSSACKITVTRKAKPITKVSLNKSQLTLTEGQKSTLTATIEPADTTESKALSWSTSNRGVATVSNGTVTAVSAGEATITAKAANGKSAVCKIKVNKKETNTPVPPANTGTENKKPETPTPPAGTEDQNPENTPSSFPDVPEGQFFTEASIWAKETGVISGYNDGRFGPSDNITREQMAVMMYRYANMLQLDVSERGELGSFPDASKVSGFAWDALEWAVGKGLITGDQGRVNPGKTADRAQCATIIMRFMNAYGL